MPAGLSQVLPRGAAQPAAQGSDRPRGCDAGLHQRLARRPTLPQRQGEEEPRRRHHPVRCAAVSPGSPDLKREKKKKKKIQIAIKISTQLVKQVQISHECAPGDLRRIMFGRVFIREKSSITTV